MALTLYEASKLIKNDLFSGIAQSIVKTDAMAAALPFVGFQGDRISYIREGRLPDTGFIPDDGTMMAASNATYDLVNVPVRRIGSDFDIDSLAHDLTGNEEVARQVISKSKATWLLACDKFVNGGATTGYTLSPAVPAITAMTYGPWLDSMRYGPGNIKYVNTGKFWSFRAHGDSAYGTPVAATTNGTYTLKSLNASKFIVVTINTAAATADFESTITFTSSTYEFDGLKRIIAPEMEIPSTGVDGDPFSFAVLDKLMLLEKVNANRFFIMSGEMINQYKAINRTTLGGITPNHVSLPGYSGQVLTYCGIPILQNDNILNNESKGSKTNLTSIYLASLDGDEGLFFGVPSTEPRLESQTVRADPRDTVVYGWRIEPLGALETKAQRRWRVQLYGCLGLRSSLALARASQIQTT